MDPGSWQVAVLPGIRLRLNRCNDVTRRRAAFPASMDPKVIANDLAIPSLLQGKYSHSRQGRGVQIVRIPRIHLQTKIFFSYFHLLFLITLYDKNLSGEMSTIVAYAVYFRQIFNPFSYFY